MEQPILMNDAITFDTPHSPPDKGGLLFSPPVKELDIAPLIRGGWGVKRSLAPARRGLWGVLKVGVVASAEVGFWKPPKSPLSGGLSLLAHLPRNST